MRVTELEISDVKIIEPDVYNDFRGYYMESYSKRTLEKFGINDIFVQDNHFYSRKKGTIRGIHFQNNPYAQSKLLRCTKGVILDVAVDLRKNSPTYKKYVMVELSADNKKQIYIPKGFGHCAMALSDEVEGQYKVDEFYYPDYDRAIRWDDPDIGIDWGTDKFIVSEKDSKAPFLRDSDVNF
ncbi:MAG: dTDP-4-dehydrorhamnose 3,5-epimerase [Ruminiclostridium sp.]|nr:dTDP-4-dehydrorhamnose 3,5-epimerase [Ruminiclostridium sp.]